MNSKENKMENKSSNKSPRRISRGSQTPKKKNKIRNEKNVKSLSKESTIDPLSAPPLTNTPRAVSVIDYSVISNYSASMIK